MALWLSKDAEPLTEQEQADLLAIEALRESAANELKEQGNEFVKKGRKYYVDALDCYTRAINQKTSSGGDNSIYYSNRSQVHLLLGNYRHALSDAKEAIKFNAGNLKAYFRAAKAAIALDLLLEAAQFCNDGVARDASNVELGTLKEQVNKRSLDLKLRQTQIMQAHHKAEALSSALAKRNVRLGPYVYKEQSGGRKAWLDSDNTIHWPVLLLYGEVMTSDFIEDFCEYHTFESHLDMVYAEDAPPLPWDEKHQYTTRNVELYYQANSVQPFEGDDVVKFFLEDVDEFEDAKLADGNKPSWVRVNRNATLLDVLKRPDFIVPGIPVFFVVAIGSSFRETFLSSWSPP